jgi:carboxylate-amine ligase
VADSAAIAAVVHALVVALAERYEELGPPVPTWRIGENRWSACRHGVEGRWVDARSGESSTMREHLHALIDELGPTAERLRCAAELAHARDLVERPRAELARAAAADGVIGVARRLTDAFLAV